MIAHGHLFEIAVVLPGWQLFTWLVGTAAALIAFLQFRRSHAASTELRSIKRISLEGKDCLMVEAYTYGAEVYGMEVLLVADYRARRPYGEYSEILQLKLVPLVELDNPVKIGRAIPYLAARDDLAVFGNDPTRPRMSMAQLPAGSVQLRVIGTGAQTICSLSSAWFRRALAQFDPPPPENGEEEATAASPKESAEPDSPQTPMEAEATNVAENPPKPQEISALTATGPSAPTGRFHAWLVARKNGARPLGPVIAGSLMLLFAMECAVFRAFLNFRPNEGPMPKWLAGSFGAALALMGLFTIHQQITFDYSNFRPGKRAFYVFCAATLIFSVISLLAACAA